MSFSELFNVFLIQLSRLFDQLFEKIPKSYAIHLGIAKGDFVKVSQAENKIIIEKA
jgi:hypothetical protein